MPEFPGGQSEMFKFLADHTIYPAEAKANNIQGKVYVNFSVGKDGLIRNIKVIKSVHPLLDNEAIRVVGVMPLWKPGTHKGTKVVVSFNLPFNFKLDNNSNQNSDSTEIKDKSHAAYSKERTMECEKKKEAYIQALVKRKMKEYKSLEEKFKIKIDVTENDIRKAGECSYTEIMKDFKLNCEYFMDLKNPKIYNQKDKPCEEDLPDVYKIIMNNR